jgi:3-hydroxyisobutyrate dehydrogenase-like beta-hydroxyacid dehydrogenase
MMDDHEHRKVGVIGLGKMGSALADSLLAKGFEWMSAYWAFPAPSADLAAV